MSSTIKRMSKKAKRAKVNFDRKTELITDLTPVVQNESIPDQTLKNENTGSISVEKDSVVESNPVLNRTEKRKQIYQKKQGRLRWDNPQRWNARFGSKGQQKQEEKQTAALQDFKDKCVVNE